MTTQRQKDRFVTFVSRVYVKIISVYKSKTSTDKSAFYFFQCLGVMYDRLFSLCYLRCLNGSSLIYVFKYFHKTKIIVRKGIFKNQNLCFTSRVKGQKWNKPNLTTTKKQRTIRIITVFSLLAHVTF